MHLQTHQRSHIFRNEVRLVAQLNLPLPLRFDVSTRDVNLIGQYWGQTAIDWLVIRRERPGGSIRADTVNTELRRVDRSLTNGHQPTGTRPLTHRLPAIPYCQAGVWVKGCGVWWYWSLDETHWETVSETSLQSESERFLALRVEPGLWKFLSCEK